MDNSTNFVILLLIVGIFIMLASQMDFFDNDDDDDNVTVIYGYDRPWYRGGYGGYWGNNRRRWGRRGWGRRRHP